MPVRHGEPLSRLCTQRGHLAKQVTKRERKIFTVIPGNTPEMELHPQTGKLFKRKAAASSNLASHLIQAHTSTQPGKRKGGRPEPPSAPGQEESPVPLSLPGERCYLQRDKEPLSVLSPTCYLLSSDKMADYITDSAFVTAAWAQPRVAVPGDSKASQDQYRFQPCSLLPSTSLQNGQELQRPLNRMRAAPEETAGPKAPAVRGSSGAEGFPSCGIPHACTPVLSGTGSWDRAPSPQPPHQRPPGSSRRAGSAAGPTRGCRGSGRADRAAGRRGPRGRGERGRAQHPARRALTPAGRPQP